MLQTQGDALAIKPYNGQFVFAEFNHQSFNYGVIEFGYGRFKTFKKGYEISAGLKLFDAYLYQPPGMKGMSLRLNQIMRKTTGKKSTSLGYKIGLAYFRQSCRYSIAEYLKEDTYYSKYNTTFSSDLLTANVEAFYNVRLAARLYLELGLGLSNGLEYVQYKGGEDGQIWKAWSGNGGPTWRDKAPGNYYHSFFTGHLRLLGAFGKPRLKTIK